MIKIAPLIEALYSNKLYRLVNIPLSLLTGLVPVSIAEVLLYGILIFVLYKFICIMKNIIKAPKDYLKLKYLYISIKKTLYLVVALYFFFIMLWGLNYYRLPFSTVLGVNIVEYSISDLEELCTKMVSESNKLREKLDEDINGVMTIKEGKMWVLKNAQLGYDIISDNYKTLSGSFGIPKPIMLSSLMSYTGITGIYFPFTGEANINMNVPYASLPSTVSHEMAHQRGYAREDEANFIAYLACINNPNIEFQYSGTLLALVYSINALHKEDPTSYEKLKASFHDGLSRDLAYISDFWKQYEGKAEKVATDINNAYLKANNQKDGVKSYGRMVDLLIAYSKANR